MRVSLGLPTHRVDRPDLITGGAVMAMARAAEEAGFDAVFVTEHPFPGEEWLASGGHHALDPFVALSFAAAATTRIRIQTNLLIVAYRNPFLAAKAIASLDALSGGRMIVGIGAGYLEAEFGALGVDIDERNELMDEAIPAMRAAWAGETVTDRGRHWAAGGNRMLPTPVQRPGPPIFVGGNSGRAMRRAVEHAAGWVPMLARAGAATRVRSRAIGDTSELAARIAAAHAHAASIGRDEPLEIAISPAGAGLDPRRNLGGTSGREEFLDHVGDLAAAGVTFLNAGVPGETAAEVIDNIAWFAAEVMPAIKALDPGR